MAHKIAHPTARTSGLPGVSELNYTPAAPGHFTEGDPVTGEPATVVTMDWLNMIQAEINHVVAQAGLPPADPNQPDNSQFHQAIPILSRWNLPVRAVINYGNTSPQGDHDASTDRGRILPCDASLGALRILLPAATAAGNGFALVILKMDNSVNSVAIVPDGSDQVQGQNQPFILTSKGQSVLLTSDGLGSWQIIANSQKNIDLSGLRTDIDLNAAEIATLSTDALDLRDGVSFDLDSADDVESGSQNVIIDAGIARNREIVTPLHISTHSGSDTTYVIPGDVTRIGLKLWGAGGGGGSGKHYGNNIAGPGGAGGYAHAKIEVSPGEPLLLSVGGGGKTTHQIGAGGGGYSAVYRGSKLLANVLITAGGGGGGASSAGGAGGGLSGEKGVSITNVGGGGGGTQLSGGSGGFGGVYTGQAGSSYQGGDNSTGTPIVDTYRGYNGGGSLSTTGVGGGGGGGGFFGGGGGSEGGHYYCGGGGGSGYIHPLAEKVEMLTGTGAIPGGVTDADYPAGAATGGAPDSDGANGAIYIYELSGYADMDWITPTETADSAVQKHRIQFLIKADNLDLNNNLRVSASSDKGTSWQSLTAQQIGTLDDGRQIIVAEGADITGGTDVQARIQTNSGIDVAISDFTHRWEN